MLPGTISRIGLLCLAVPVLLAGCIAGPTALRASRVAYNDAIQSTTDEQLLLNLVRLKYRDVPFFLEVSSVSTQFTFEESLSGSVTLNENVGVAPLNPDVYGISGRLGYSERPTISYAPLQGQDFVERLLSPLTPETILLLSRSGWNIDRVLRLSVQRLNDLDNAASASGPTPLMAPRYERFARAALLFRQLQLRKGIVLAYESREVTVADSIAADSIAAGDLVQALQAGYLLKRSADEQSYTLAKTSSGSCGASTVSLFCI